MVPRNAEHLVSRPHQSQKGNTMKRRTTLSGLAAALLLVGLAAFGENAAAQSAKQLAGAYSGVSFTVTDPAGKTVLPFGPNPRAMLILTEDGHYTLVVMRESLPKFASNNRTVATAEENQAVVAGSLGHFGKYTVDENDRSITFHVDSATFANWDKLPQKRSLALNGDQLSYKVAAASGGGTAEVVWKRIK